MKNYVQPGNAVTAITPAGGVSSGAGVLIGNLFGIAATTEAATDEVEIATVGVFDINKVAGTAVAVGDPIYWDDGNSECTPDDDTGNNLRIGVAIAAAADVATIARVRLDGAAS